jgi:sugar/nucleoside kinase (ribokinase family)
MDSVALLAHADALFVSEEDLPAEDVQRTVAGWSRTVPIVALTRGDGGAEVCFGGEWRHIGAFQAKSIDPTGAGDVFAAAFLIRYHETNDPWEAARFASASASCVIEVDGVLGVPGREQIEARLLSRPDIVARPF